MSLETCWCKSMATMMLAFPIPSASAVAGELHTYVCMSSAVSMRSPDRSSSCQQSFIGVCERLRSAFAFVLLSLLMSTVHAPSLAHAAKRHNCFGGT